MLVDVHTHLTHEKFAHDLTEVLTRCQDQMGAIVVNGLNPASNRQILELQSSWPVVKAALGIYPLDGICHLESSLPFPIEKFDVDSEIQFIHEKARAKEITAIGECGLDAYWVGEETFKEQERVFIKLIEIALEQDLPLIIHTRKRERRAMEILAAHQVTRVNFHCYGGRSKWALSAAEAHGWYFSIPANAHKNELFQKLLRHLPLDRILTETDAPYLAPEKGERNEPINVQQTIGLLGQLRGLEPEEAKARVWQNYQRLFQIKTPHPDA